MAMQQSSSSIGALATALAKAQIELVNPEKSMIATIRSDDKSAAEQIFRYAPLSSGLEILRRTLGQHEIAILQATAIDQAAGVVKLTTTLCHSSGEWVGSTWPVCSVEDMASPKRMGAALTYARRYALFTLAGIAGEDDLDAPDLNAPEPAAEVRNTKQSANGQTRPTGRRKTLAQGKLNFTSANPALKGQLSAVLRDELCNQLNDIDSAEAAAIWARRILPAKNSLCAADARQLEDAFEERLVGLDNPRPSPFGSKRKDLTSLERKGPESTGTSTVEKIETSGLTHAEPRRVRDREHVKFVAGHPCLICGRRPADPHHLRFAQSRALGRKVSDEFTVPLCRGHHREVHRYGDEAAWWAKVGVDPLVVANALWRETHPLT
jgi:ERF superfamily